MPKKNKFDDDKFDAVPAELLLKIQHLSIADLVARVAHENEITYAEILNPGIRPDKRYKLVNDAFLNNIISCLRDLETGFTKKDDIPLIDLNILRSKKFRAKIKI